MIGGILKEIWLFETGNRQKNANLLHVFETPGSYLHHVANKRQIAAAPD
jgi:hypothetical protein